MLLDELPSRMSARQYWKTKNAHVPANTGKKPTAPFRTDPSA